MNKPEPLVALALADLTAEDLRWLIAPEKHIGRYVGAERALELIASGKFIALRVQHVGEGIILLEPDGADLHVHWIAGKGFIRNVKLGFELLTKIRQSLGFKRLTFCTPFQGLARAYIRAGADIAEYTMELV